MAEERDFLMFSDSSSAGSPPEPEMLLNDVIVAIQEAKNEQKLNTDKIIRGIILGVMLMTTVMILCTLVLFFKPSNCAASVKDVQGDPAKNITMNIAVHVHVHVNDSSFYDTPEDECSILDKKVYEMALHDATIDCKEEMKLYKDDFTKQTIKKYKEEMADKTLSLFAGMGLGFTTVISFGQVSA